VVFYHPVRDLSLVVHGDDFTFCGVDEDLRWIKGLMESWFEIKMRGVLGPGEGEVRQITLLGRLITWTSEGIEYEADPKHRQMVLDYFGLGEGSKEVVGVNGEKEEEEQPGAAAWERLYSGKLVSEGFVRGDSYGVVFYHPVRDLSLVVHGDDFTFCGVDEDLRWIKGLMESWFEIKMRGVLGPGEGEVRQITLLGRLITWTSEGIEYEADPKHRQMVLDYFGLGEGSKEVVGVNGEKEEEEQPGDEVELVGKEATEFRAVAARVNYLSLDLP
jgi:hypothetical protein